MEQIIQNTPEWMAWRHKGIGASEASVIMGVSRFKTPKELYKQKISPTPPKDKKNFIHEKGHKLEDIARKNYELETFDDWKPKLAVHCEEERFRASLDGWNETLEAVWECKYLGLEKYESLRNEKLPLMERIPSEYWPQLMHQVMVTNAKEVHLTGIVDDKVLKTLEKGQTEQFTLSFPVDADCTKYIVEKLIPKLFEFLKCIDEKTPPETSKDDIVITKNAELGKLLTKYKSVKTKMDKLSKEEKELKKEIFKISLSIHNRVECKGHKITETVGIDKETPDYEAYLKSLPEWTSDEDLIKNRFVKISKGRKIQKITLKKTEKK